MPSLISTGTKHMAHIHLCKTFMHVKLIYLKDHTDYGGDMSRELSLESSGPVLKLADYT